MHQKVEFCAKLEISDIIKTIAFGTTQLYLCAMSFLHIKPMVSYDMFYCYGSRLDRAQIPAIKTYVEYFWHRNTQQTLIKTD